MAERLRQRVPQGVRQTSGGSNSDGQRSAIEAVGEELAGAGMRETLLGCSLQRFIHWTE